jgi:hypothetical protein
VVAAWQACEDKSEVIGIVNLCRPLLVKHWKASPYVLNKLRAVVNETEAAAFASFTNCTDGTALMQFFSRYVSRILGWPVPFSERDLFEDIMLGIKYADLASDPIFLGWLCILLVAICSANKKAVERCRTLYGLEFFKIK